MQPKSLSPPAAAETDERDTPQQPPPRIQMQRPVMGGQPSWVPARVSTKYLMAYFSLIEASTSDQSLGSLSNAVKVIILPFPITFVIR